MRILIEGAGFVNKGAEAMLKTVMSEFRRRIPHASFFVEYANVYPGTEELFESAGLKILKSCQTSRIQKLHIFLDLIRKNPAKIGYFWKQKTVYSYWESLLSNVDLIVDISGYRYSQTLGSYGALRTAPIIDIAKRTNKPYIFLPQAWGPFDDKTLLQKVCHESCSKSTLFYARDIESRDHLASLLDKNIEEVKQAPDIAFCFDNISSSFGVNYLESQGISVSEKPILCVAPNMRVYERSSGFGLNNLYLNLISKLCSDFVDKGFLIIFVPHEIKPNPRQTDDRWLCELLHLSLGNNKHSIAVTENLSAEEIKSIIALCNLLIGSRFHAIIAALHSRIPAVSIGWAHKYVELMRDVGLDKFVINYQELEEQTIKEIVQVAWEEKEANKKKLEEKVPLLEKLSSSTFDQVLEAIDYES